MSLLAGAARREISPSKPMFLIGYPHVERTSTGIHDPLYASALCLRNGAAGVLFIALDLLFIDPQTADEVRQAIAARVALEPGQILISCTHTHSGPPTMDMLSFRADPIVPPPDPDYVAQIKSAMIEAAVEAFAAVRPAELAFTTAQAVGVGGNRLALDGVADPEVGLLVVRDLASKTPLAVSLTYAMHPTVLHEDSKLVSSDFPGYTRQCLERALGGQVTVLYHTAPAGDQSPRNYVRAQTFAEAERLGLALGEAALASIRALEDEAFTSEPVLAARQTRVSLPRRRLPELADAEQNLTQCLETFARLQREGVGHGPVRTAECAVFGAEETVFLAQCQEDGEIDRFMARHYQQAEVQVLRVGGCYLVGLPGELFVEYALAIKRQSPRPAVVISLANGELQGYIVTPEAARQGGYEATNSLFQPEAGQFLVEAALGLIGELESSEPAALAR